ncbi:UNVERIFIED_CONTAM: hypothetical protein FKN15_074997 [Acipenser sinensis]
MSEFRIHHDVNELLSLLRVRGGDGAEVYIDLLQKNRTPYVTTTVSAHSAKVKIAEYSKTPEDFLKKYDELKSRNVRNLDPLVYLLSKLTEDKETLQYLQQNAKDRADISANATASTTTNFHIPQTSTKMSIQELEELRKKLGNVTASSNLQQPLEVTRKVLRDKHNKKNPLQPIPVFPNWVYERPALIGDFITVSSGSTDTTVPIDPYHMKLHLTTEENSFHFKKKKNIRFIEEKSSFEYGQVNHALAAGMRTLIKEYMILVTQLEHLQRQGMLSLQKLWFYIQPTMRTMEILASLATSVDKGDCMGGSTLSLLHDRTFNYTGDSQAQELCLFLTKASSVPYFEILEKWIYRGIIKDPYRSIKHYFLMDQGDFFVSFMDLTEEELKKPVDDIIPTRLEALLELALRMSTANTDPFKDDLKASNIDDVLCHHTSFLDNCLKDCMLTNPELLKIFSKLMSVCVMFTNCMQRFTQSMKLDGEMSRLTLEHGTMRGPPTQNERTEEAEKKKLTSKYLSEHVDALQSAAGFEGTINKFDSRSGEEGDGVPYPEKVQYALTIEGKNYTINLEKNRILLGKDYTETHYLQNGTEITSSPNVEYTKYNKDMQEMRSRMLEVVNHVDKLYRPVNVRVVLVGLEVWTYRDKFVVSTDPDKTLSSFLAWRKTDLFKKKKHDNAQFVTGISFEGSTVGLATKFAMCSGDSGAVNEDHNRNPIGVASTIAHEMGHNLGMSHDDSDCICEASKSRKGCIMADSIGNIYPHSFSSCSQQALQQFLSQYNPSCLLSFTQGTTGTFIWIFCSYYVKPAGDVCRHSVSDCDLPEYCTGLSPQCPENAFQMNGSPCKFGQGYCFNGECPTHQQHCITLWGPAARVAPDPCFQQNKRGDEHAHCKKNLNGYQSCAEKDIKCGKIHCQDGNMFPITKQKYTMILPWAVQCKIAEMSNDADSEDLGLVPSGTKCEERKVCYNGRCQDLDIYETEDCSAKCNNHGVCNHKKECHCDAGWSPPYCDVKLSELPKGGNAIIIGVTVAVAVLILAAIITGGLMFCRCSRKENYPSKTKEKSGLSNPLFQRGGNKGSPRVGTPKISRPIFLESSSSPQLCTPLCVTVIPSQPPPQPPKAVEQSPMKYNTTSGQAKPVPPTKPLPNLKAKPDLGYYSITDQKPSEGKDLGYYSITDQKPSEEYVQISKQSNIQMQKQEEWKYIQRDRPGHNINQHAHLDPSVRLLMEEKDQALLALHETVEI